MIEVGVYDAKTRLSELIRAIEGGERVVITLQGRPIAELVPYQGEDPPASPAAAP